MGGHRTVRTGRCCRATIKARMRVRVWYRRVFSLDDHDSRRLNRVLGVICVLVVPVFSRTPIPYSAHIPVPTRQYYHKYIRGTHPHFYITVTSLPHLLHTHTKNTVDSLVRAVRLHYSRAFPVPFLHPTHSSIHPSVPQSIHYIPHPTLPSSCETTPIRQKSSGHADPPLPNLPGQGV